MLVLKIRWNPKYRNNWSGLNNSHWILISDLSVLISFFFFASFIAYTFLTSNLADEINVNGNKRYIYRFYIYLWSFSIFVELFTDSERILLIATRLRPFYIYTMMSFKITFSDTPLSLYPIFEITCLTLTISLPLQFSDELV